MTHCDKCGKYIWFFQAVTYLHDIITEGNKLVKDTKTVNPDRAITSGSTTSMSGYTIIEVDSMDAALEIAKACPFLDIGGSIEVSELVQMSM